MMKKFFSDNNQISGYNTDFDYPTEKSAEQIDLEQYRCASGTSLEEQYCINDDSELLKKAERVLANFLKEQNKAEKAFWREVRTWRKRRKGKLILLRL
ncbi:MAG: hypothetical protein K2G83_03650 [Ruminococcus sp.]|nr:hypothetical protein [Ruminococcus sp.]